MVQKSGMYSQGGGDLGNSCNLGKVWFYGPVRGTRRLRRRGQERRTIAGERKEINSRKEHSERKPSSGML